MRLSSGAIWDHYGVLSPLSQGHHWFAVRVEPGPAIVQDPPRTVPLL